MPTISEERPDATAEETAVAISAGEKNERRMRREAIMSGNADALMPSGLTVRQERTKADLEARIYRAEQVIRQAASRGKPKPKGADAELAALQAKLAAIVPGASSKPTTAPTAEAVQTTEAKPAEQTGALSNEPGNDIAAGQRPNPELVHTTPDTAQPGVANPQPTIGRNK